MKKHSLKLCFFWHMHQPDYRDSSGVMRMPWVFLHAIKDYYEMPWLLNRHEGLKATFNITAPLIEQLNLYKDPLKNDYFLLLWEKHPSELNEDARNWLIKICKSTQYETMVKPLPYFDELYHHKNLNDEEFIDLEVLFMLAWCGHYLRQENRFVKQLFHKGKNFTQSDKARLLKTLCAFIETILPFYAKLQKAGVISLSTTPYNHPILPLLLDMNNAKKANVHTTLPADPMSLRDDAIAQVERSILLYEKTFGVKPKGFWPAEGAVDEESLGIYKEKGLSWIATDEEILFHSLDDKTRSRLYRPYRYNGMTIGFRDHSLSDLIGFNYRFKSGKDAVDHFMQVLEPIADIEDATVFVILDGENAWEFFENNAYDFFTTLYNRFSTTAWCQTRTMDEISQSKKQGILKKLSPGSWIHGNFDTWSGHPEKNRAWELIYQTKRDVAKYAGVIPDETAEKIKFHFLASECSDWFWWYGDDHVTEYGLEFDTLFRGHLIAVYHLLNISPPSDLFVTILSRANTVPFLVKPRTAISPSIDGKQKTFFEWIGAGSIDEAKFYSTMDKARGPVDKILYGQDDDTVFIAFKGDMASLADPLLQFELIIEETGEHVVFSMQRSSEVDGIKFRIDKEITLSIPKKRFSTDSTVHLHFEIVKGNDIIQALPGYGALSIDVNESYEENWFV